MIFGIGLGAAVMTLLGDRAWWFPSWLDRLLPQLEVEGRDDADPSGQRDRPRPALPHGQPAPAGASEG